MAGNSNSNICYRDSTNEDFLEDSKALTIIYYAVMIFLIVGGYILYNLGMHFLGLVIILVSVLWILVNIFIPINKYEFEP